MKKNTNAPRSGLFLKDTKVIPFITSQNMPLSPLPSIVAAIYLKGSIPERPNIVDWVIPQQSPKGIKAANIIQNAEEPSVIAINGNPIINAPMIKNDPEMRKLQAE